MKKTILGVLASVLFLGAHAVSANTCEQRQARGLRIACDTQSLPVPLPFPGLSVDNTLLPPIVGLGK